jgi:hypothetical protein
MGVPILQLPCPCMANPSKRFFGQPNPLLWLHSLSMQGFVGCTPTLNILLSIFLVHCLRAVRADQTRDHLLLSGPKAIHDKCIAQLQMALTVGAGKNTVVRASALDGPIEDKVFSRYCCHSFKCSVKGVQNDRTVKALFARAFTHWCSAHCHGLRRVPNQTEVAGRFISDAPGVAGPVDLDEDGRNNVSMNSDGVQQTVDR